MSKKLEFECVFCGTPTNFKDNSTAYCIDCYVKVRNSAHSHLPVNPWPVSPMPTTPLEPYKIDDYPSYPVFPRIIC